MASIIERFRFFWLKLFSKEVDTLVSESGVVIKFPRPFRVFDTNGFANLFDPKDRHFAMFFSFLKSEEKEFKVERALEIERGKNPNATICAAGKYDCVALRHVVKITPKSVTSGL